MKHLKLFEELKSGTYNKAATKLQNMGHKRRSKELYDWSDIVRKREESEKWSKLGTFEISFYQTKWDSKKNTSHLTYLFDGQFYISLEVDIDYIFERFLELENPELKTYFWLLFFYGVYPANQETIDKMNSHEIVTGYAGGYSESNLSIKVSENRFEILPKAELYFEPWENLTYIPSNRKEALKLHRLLVNLFEQKIELPVHHGHGTISRLRSIVEEKTGDKKLWNRMVSSVKNLPLNYLYRD